MSYESREQTFLYHAYGLGLGGWIEREHGVRFMIESVAPGALSVVGGTTESSQTKFTFQQGNFSLSVDEAITKLRTQETDKEWITEAESTLLGFDLCGRVTAKKIVSRLTSRHKKQKDKGKRESIVSEGSTIEGLSIDGCDVPIIRDAVLDDFPSYSDLIDILGGKKLPIPKPGFDALQCAAWSKNLKQGHLLASKKDDPKYIHDLAKMKSPKMTRCTIIQPIRPLDLKNARPHGYSVEIDDFGRIFFGEVLVADGMKRLNMIRWDLGCEDCGGGTGGTTDINGVPMP